MILRRPLPRRAVLRGLGAGGIGLPLLDAMETRAQPAAEPNRLVVLYFPNGTHGSAQGTDLYPTGDGASYTMAAPWAALQPHRADLTILKNVRNNPADLGDPPNHPRAGSCFLTCVPIKKSYIDIRAGVSMDQIVADKIGAGSRFPSLVLASGGEVSITNEGYSPIYYQNISWRSEKQPVTRIDHPRLLFDRLFGAADETANDGRRLQRKSVLDFARDEANRLSARLGTQDRQKLDEYLTSVREVETIVSAPALGGSCTGGVAPGASLPFADQLRATLDLIVIVLRCNASRVITFMMDTARSNRSGAFAGVTGGHHNISHHSGDAENIRKLLLINKFYAEIFAHFLVAMKAAKEPEGSLLDNSMVLFGSGLGESNAHRKDHLPLVIAGRGRGRLNPGRALALPANTPLANVHLTLMRHMGADVASFGDSSGTVEL